jgi:hypothetical protein
MRMILPTRYEPLQIQGKWLKNKGM